MDTGRNYSGLEGAAASLKVLNTTKIRMKFNETRIVTSKLVYRYKIFLNCRNMEE
jgi:hypothetical protein